MSIERSDVEKIAYLARIQMPEDQLEKVTQDLSRILGFVDQMQTVSTDGIAPMSHPLDLVQRLRPDAVTETNQRERFQAIAPATEAGLYLVPKVIE
jgi:aspartyl-tRNA(Asn)/glutamyl-tRNA(Gln) amidotransferase subunit C